MRRFAFQAGKIRSAHGVRTSVGAIEAPNGESGAPGRFDLTQLAIVLVSAGNSATSLSRAAGSIRAVSFKAKCDWKYDRGDYSCVVSTSVLWRVRGFPTIGAVDAPSSRDGMSQQFDSSRLERRPESCASAKKA